jgi:hypothetical protein
VHAYTRVASPDPPSRTPSSILAHPRLAPHGLFTSKQVLDVLNRMGMSDSLLRMIERRQNMDKLLAYGGMLFIVLFVGGLYWWLKM